MAKTSSIETTREPSEDGAFADCELDAVTGGTSQPAPKLYEAACKGTHIPEVTIELW